MFSGLTLDTFNRHPEKVAMANCAQLINCLNSLYLAHEEKFCVTRSATFWNVCRTPGWTIFADHLLSPQREL